MLRADGPFTVTGDPDVHDVLLVLALDGWWRTLGAPHSESLRHAYRARQPADPVTALITATGYASYRGAEETVDGLLMRRFETTGFPVRLSYDSLPLVLHFLEECGYTITVEDVPDQVG